MKVFTKRLGRWAALGAALVLAACTNPSGSSDEAVFRIRACRESQREPAGEVFRVTVRNPAQIRAGEALIGKRKNVTGTLRAGDGGFNAPWSWHLDPETVEFVDASIEVCDGCPGDIERDRDYWLQTVRVYCPWGAEILARER